LVAEAVAAAGLGAHCDAGVDRPGRLVRTPSHDATRYDKTAAHDRALWVIAITILWIGRDH
jgi:hypothetical protein